MIFSSSNSKQMISSNNEKNRNASNTDSDSKTMRLNTKISNKLKNSQLSAAKSLPRSPPKKCKVMLSPDVSFINRKERDAPESTRDRETFTMNSSKEDFGEKCENDGINKNVYCFNCKCLICMNCEYLDQHSKHKVKKIKMIIESMNQKRESLESIISQISIVLSKYEFSRRQALKKKQEEAMLIIDSEFNDILEKVNRQRDIIREDVCKITADIEDKEITNEILGGYSVNQIKDKLAIWKEIVFIPANRGVLEELNLFVSIFPSIMNMEQEDKNEDLLEQKEIMSLLNSRGSSSSIDYFKNSLNQRLSLKIKPFKLNDIIYLKQNKVSNDDSRQDQSALVDLKRNSSISPIKNLEGEISDSSNDRAGILQVIDQKFSSQQLTPERRKKIFGPISSKGSRRMNFSSRSQSKQYMHRFSSEIADSDNSRASKMRSSSLFKSLANLDPQRIVSAFNSPRKTMISKSGTTEQFKLSKSSKEYLRSGTVTPSLETEIIPVDGEIWLNSQGLTDYNMSQYGTLDPTLVNGMIIDLSYNELSSTGLELFLYSIRKCRQIKRVDLTQNHISKNGLLQLCRFMLDKRFIGCIVGSVELKSNKIESSERSVIPTELKMRIII